MDTDPSEFVAEQQDRLVITTSYTFSHNSTRRSLGNDEAESRQPPLLPSGIHKLHTKPTFSANFKIVAKTDTMQHASPPHFEQGQLEDILKVVADNYRQYTSTLSLLGSGR